LGLWGVNYNDSSLEKLKVFKKLKQLELDDTQITDAGLEHLSGLINLEALHCRRCPSLKGTGFSYLAGATKMKRLMLRESIIKNEALPHLKGMKELDTLELS